MTVGSHTRKVLPGTYCEKTDPREAARGRKEASD